MVTDRFLRFCAVALSAALALVGPAARADPVEYYAGVTFTSNFVSDGMTETRDGAAVQPYLEAKFNGFYAGIWGSTVDFATADRAEVDLYLGYRTAVLDGRLGLDLGYARYFFDDSGDCCGELTLSALYAVTDRFGIGGYVAYDPVVEAFNRRATLEYKVNDRLAVSARWGKIDAGGRTYWDAGGSYAFNDIASLDLRYYGASAGDPGLVLSLSFATTQGTLRRLFGTAGGRR